MTVVSSITVYAIAAGILGQDKDGRELDEFKVKTVIFFAKHIYYF
jgi:hypothetical protein